LEFRAPFARPRYDIESRWPAYWSDSGAGASSGGEAAKTAGRGT